MTRHAIGLLATLTAGAFAGCGGGTPAHHASGRPGTRAAPSPAVTVLLHRGTRASATFCGALHHVHIYGRGIRIAATGRVTPVPSGPWKVKLQIKVCRNSAYHELAKVHVTREGHGGKFTSTLSALPTGDYALRAVLYLSDGSRVKSPKRHLAIR